MVRERLETPGLGTKGVYMSVIVCKTCSCTTAPW